MNKGLSTNIKGVYTHNEIYSQPDAWDAAVAVLAENLSDIRSITPLQGDQVIFTGCGSTYYLALAAASLTQQMTGLLSRAFPASEVWLYPRSSYVDRKSLLVAISRSGETTETLQACESFLNDKRGVLMTLSCYNQMPLAKKDDFRILVPVHDAHDCKKIQEKCEYVYKRPIDHQNLA